VKAAFFRAASIDDSTPLALVETPGCPRHSYASYWDALLLLRVPDSYRIKKEKKKKKKCKG